MNPSSLLPPARLADHVVFGTCSWKYDSWKGLFYESGRKYYADDYLVDYSQWLKSVEIDQWFWSLFPGPDGLVLPDPKTVSTYAVSVPSTFEFTVKAPNSITLTHFYAKQPAKYKDYANRPNELFLSADLFTRFLDLLEPLEGRLGPIMLQFEYLNRQKMPSKQAFFDQLGNFLSVLPKTHRYGVETRNPYFLGKPYFDLLTEFNVAHVFLDGYHMPPVTQTFKQYGGVTTDFSIIRLHGPDRHGIERVTKKKWDQIVQPQDSAVENVAEMIDQIAGSGVKTFVNVNNHWEGSAPLSIERLVNAMNETKEL